MCDLWSSKIKLEKRVLGDNFPIVVVFVIKLLFDINMRVRFH